MKLNYVVLFSLINLLLGAQQNTDPAAEPDFAKRLLNNNQHLRASNTYTCRVDSIRGKAYKTSFQLNADHKLIYSYNTSGENTSIEGFVLDTVTNLWSKESLTNFSYLGGDMVNGILYAWNTSTWVTSWQYNYTYDTSHNLIILVGQHWTGSQWENFYRTSYTISVNNSPQLMLRENWSHPQQAWIKLTLEEHDYSSNGDDTVTIIKAWNASVSSWMSQQRLKRVYDANHNLSSTTLHNWNQGNNSWTPTFNYSNSYNASNQCTLNLVQQWNTQNSAWVNDHRSTMVYNGSNLSSRIVEYWYTLQNNWQNNLKQTYTYNNYGYMTESFTESWDFNQSLWFASADTLTFYSCKESDTGILNYQKEKSNLVLYPNPGSQDLQVSGVSDFDRLKIFDLNGKLVLESRQTKFSVSSLSPGIYVAEVYDTRSQFVGKQKLVKE